MTSRFWVQQLQRLPGSVDSEAPASVTISPARSEPDLWEVLGDFRAADWEELLHALAWPSPDRSTLEHAFGLQPDEELLPVVATALEQLGGGSLRQVGTALDCLIDRHQHSRDRETSRALLTLVKLTGMLGRGAAPRLLQELALDTSRDAELRDEAAAALCGYDTPYDSSFWDKLDYHRDSFFIPAGLSFHAESHPRRALEFLVTYAPLYGTPAHLEVPTSTALYRLLSSDGVAAVRDALAHAPEAAFAIVERVLRDVDFKKFGPDLVAALRPCANRPTSDHRPARAEATSPTVEVSQAPTVPPEERPQSSAKTRGVRFQPSRVALSDAPLGLTMSELHRLLRASGVSYLVRNRILQKLGKPAGHLSKPIRQKAKSQSSHRGQRGIGKKRARPGHR